MRYLLLAMAAGMALVAVLVGIAWHVAPQLAGLLDTL